MAVKKETKEKKPVQKKIKTAVKKTTEKVLDKKKELPVKKTSLKKAVEKQESVKQPVEILNENINQEDELSESQMESIIAGKPRYFEAIGRRKTSTARVRLFTQGKKDILVNDLPIEEYFKTEFQKRNVISPLQKINCYGKFGVTVFVNGGGLTGQSEAARHGISRALVSLNPYFKKRLKKSGYLTRDSRMRERKKPGLKRARRAPQWSKR